MTLSEFLKVNTKQLHDETEAKFKSNKIFDKAFSLDDYKNLILGNYFLIKTYEKNVFETIPPEIAEKINLSQRRKINAIKKDLKNLNIEEPFVQTAGINEHPEALGILYVMEGSTLGGNVIAKQLSKTPGFEDVRFSYFGIYGENTGNYWKSFKETIDETPHQYFEKILNGTLKAYETMLSASL